MPAAAAHPVAAGFRSVSVAAVDRESDDVVSLTLQDPEGHPLQTALPGQYVVVRLRAECERLAVVSQLLAFGSAIERALSHQREARTKRRGRSLSAGVPGRRPPGHQLATWQLHTAGGSPPRRAAQRWNRCDAGSRDAVRARGVTVGAVGLVALSNSGRAAPSFRCGGPALDGGNPKRAAPCLL